MAVPRVQMHGATDGVALPQPLSPAMAARIRRIFALQDRGDIAAAMRDSARISDTLLTGTILADRYLGPYHRSTPEELQAWLAHYADQPGARAIYALLLRRLPRGAKPISAPADTMLPDAMPDLGAPHAFSGAGLPSVSPLVLRGVIARASVGETALALRMIAANRALTAPAAALLRAEIARVLFARNQDSAALALASQALQAPPPGERVALAGTVAGLAAWRLGKFDQATELFTAAAGAPIGDDDQHAQAAFWAGRALLRQGHGERATAMFREAATYHHAFYGMLAARLLDPGPSSDDLLSQADVDAIAATAPGTRAFALLQVGKPALAEAEFATLWPAIQQDPALGHSMILLARALGFNDLAMRFAAWRGHADAPLSGPAPHLAPRGGFRIDPALVYGLTRVESNFDPHAVSASGARGLMQIMPVTARYIAHEAGISGAALHDPAVNLELGQRYVAYLSHQANVDGDLLALLASYNSGPNNFAHWAETLHDGGDPLLFIEAIPAVETRDFVKRTLTYTWIYANRLHLPAPSLDALAADQFPRFPSEGNTGKILAASGMIH
ncbi:MAG: lytic transglycosylase domain-containing protein [Rhodospirillales bacterium]|nr:lytic transglycosylase domain-containing protein [Rhodospirillales bacterium]